MALLLAEAASAAQLPVIAAIPDTLPAADRNTLSQERAELVTQRETITQQVQAHNAQCPPIPENSPLVAPCTATKNDLQGRITQHIQRVLAFNDSVHRAVACIAVAQQAERGRAQIEQQRKTLQASQDELSEWTKLNAEAQKQAVDASVKFVLGKFVSNVDAVRGSVSKLEQHAKYLASQASKSKKYQTRMKYITQLDAALAKLEPMQGNLMDKVVVNTGLETEKAWSVARDTMHYELRVASKQNATTRKILENAQFKEAFTGEDIGTPGLDVLSALTEQAIEDLGKMQHGLEWAEKLTGPTILAAVFVRDALYSALFSSLSTQRVLQQSDLSGELARAAGSLQKQYKKSIDALHACQSALAP